MTKYLLLIGLVWAVWLIWRKGRTSSHDGVESQTVEREAERMVECARCGVNQPVSESILANGRYYCCQAHLRGTPPGDA
ncbi:PP0621 family protein [Accumulibacter sp.]|uniref:PP0621 family protein n=1 Tax=Accumulibacter sp. TaxID=2053492 RepID=UPI0028C40067|nr:PP0621 family protein [Accumulibacter sp.]